MIGLKICILKLLNRFRWNLADEGDDNYGTSNEGKAQGETSKS